MSIPEYQQGEGAAAAYSRIITHSIRLLFSYSIYSIISSFSNSPPRHRRSLCSHPALHLPLRSSFFSKSTAYHTASTESGWTTSLSDWTDCIVRVYSPSLSLSPLTLAYLLLSLPSIYSHSPCCWTISNPLAFQHWTIANSIPKQDLGERHTQQQHSFEYIYTYIHTSNFNPLPHQLLSTMVASSNRRARPSRRSQLLAATVAAAAAATTTVSAQNSSTGGTSSGTGGAGLDNGGINATAKANTWAVVGAPQVSAQQLFRGQGNKVGVDALQAR